MNYFEKLEKILQTYPDLIDDLQDTPKGRIWINGANYFEPRFATNKDFLTDEELNIKDILE
jgi:hypothetical protein